MSDADIDEELFALAGGDDEDVEEGEASSVSAPSSPADSLGSDAMEESDSEDGGDEEPPSRSADVPYPLEGKYVNAADKAAILAKPQLERERILGERAEEMNKIQWKEELARRAQRYEPGDERKRKADSVEPDDDSQRKTSRPVKKGRTSDKLEAYRRDREQKADRDRQRTDDRRNRHRSSSEDRDRRSDIDADGESEVDYPEYESLPRQEEPATLEHFESCRVGRSFFAEVCFNPGFESAIPGSFVRVGAGKDSRNETVYKMAQIKGFTTGKPYVFEGKHGRVATDQYATVQHGASKKEYNFSFLSNQRFTEAEFHAYKQSLAEINGKVPTKANLEKKYGEIKAFNDHYWTDVEISERLAKRAKYLHMLNSGRSSNSAPKLPTPAELEARRIAELNNKNRAQDSVRVRKALIEERRQEKLQRRQREQEYRQKKAEEEAKKKAEEEKAAFKTGIDDLFDGDSRAGTPAAGTPKPAGEKKKEPKGLPTFRKPKMDDDIVASLDLGLEIEI